MLFVPLPFVISLLLLLLLARMVLEGGARAPLRPFLAMAAGYALLSAVVGLRWGYGFTALMPVAALLASLLPPVAWIAFSGLATGRSAGLRDGVHALPPLAVAACFALVPEVVDWMISAISLGYGAALVKLAANGTDGLAGATFDGSLAAHRALMASGAMLVFSGLVDAFIAIDFLRAGGAHAGAAVTAANLTGLLVLGWAAAAAGRSQPADDAADGGPPPSASASAEDHDIAARVAALVEEQGLYRDPDLTLNRLARRALIPARRISSAINRARGESVSQFINGYRVREACRLLASSERPVTAVMFEAGFQTKSNFNREFLRQTGSSPAEWRRKSDAPRAAS